MANAIETVAAAFKAMGANEGKAVTLKAACISAYKDAGTETPALRAAAINGFMVGYLALKGADALAKAAAIAAKKGAGSKAIATARRTEKQDKAYDAARKALQRVRDKAGVEASDARGKTSQKGAQAARKATAEKPAPKADKTATHATPKVNGDMLAAFIRAAIDANLPKETDVIWRNAFTDCRKALADAEKAIKAKASKKTQAK